MGAAHVAEQVVNTPVNKAGQAVAPARDLGDMFRRQEVEAANGLVWSGFNGPQGLKQAQGEVVGL